MLHTIINLCDVFYTPQQNDVKSIINPVNSLDLQNPIIDKGEFSTNPYDYISKLKNINMLSEKNMGG